MAEEKVSGKWAGEAYDFFTLFGKINKSVYGLLLVEIGWVLLLIMISKLSPTGNNSAPAKILYPGGEIPVLQLLIPGIVVFFILWCFWSGIYFYLWVPVKLIINFILGILSIPFLLLIAVLNAFLIYPIASLIRKRQISKYIANLNDQQKKTIETSFGKIVTNQFQTLLKADDQRGIEKLIGKRAAKILKKSQEEISDNESAFFEEEIFRAGLYKYVNDEIKTDPWFLLKWAATNVLNWFTSVSAQVNIGLAPVQGISFEESRSSTKMVAQTYSTAVGRIRSRLKGIEAIQYVKFHILPEHISPQDAVQAERLRNWLGFNILLWGSYISGANEKIWINSTSLLGIKKEKDEEHGFTLPKIFLRDIDLEPFTLVIDQNKLWDMYIILVYSIVMALKAKSIGSTIDAYRNKRKFDEIVADLLFDAFLKLPPVKEKDDFFTWPDELLTNLASQWVGYKIGEYSADEKEVKFIFDNKEKLFGLITKCIERNPLVSENYYRAGAIACLCENVEEAIKLFSRAWILDSVNPTKDREIGARTEIDTALIFLNNSFSNQKELLLVRIATYSAVAINLGDQEVKNLIHKGLETKSLYNLRDALNEFTNQELIESPALRTLKILLSDSYPLKNLYISEGTPGDEFHNG